MITLVPQPGRRVLGRADARVAEGRGRTARTRPTGRVASSRRRSDPAPGDQRPDEELTDLAARGDTAAYEALARRHSARIHRTAYRVVGNHEDAEDITQDVLLTLWTSLGSYTGSAPFTTWLHRVVLNRSVSVLRARRPVAPPSPDGVVGWREWDGAADVERAVLARDQLRIVTRAITALPPPLRSVFTLRHVQGRSYQEVADSLALPEPTVRGRLARARRQLTATLGG